MFIEHRMAHLIGCFKFVAEREAAADKLIHHDTERPQVNLQSVTSLQHHFWSHVVRSPYHRECPAVVLIQPLRNPKVNHSQVTVGVKHHVFGLQISVHNIPVVQTFKDEHQGRDVKTRLGPGHDGLQLTHGSMKFATSDQFSEDVDSRFRLECFHQRDDKRMVVGTENVNLSRGLVGFPPSPNLDTFQRVPHARAPVFHEAHHTCCAVTDDFHPVQVCSLDVRVLQLYASLKLLLQGFRENLAKASLLDGPQLCEAAGHSDGGCPRLIKEQSTFTEVRSLSDVSNGLAVNEHLHRPVRDDVKGRAHLALNYYVGILLVPL
mmetsp:Transcript_43696/g.115451  ORF Transcript_43696/g.115451 Transcript_43696/m.115451 type:complete len:320 (-) Transcript_43696:946-1905(-)